ncbi:Transmembrane protein 42 [Liparis tanakae]|uniref:Transmembrane protein 42 n=1 Tax=Liparis tanakae TaxID=230148 RepID=A0A4Z2IM61_9TELE|nr:Transmembrane protein 42 [Liparis tanakae]
MRVTTSDSSSGVECPSDMVSGTVCALLAGCLGAAASLSAKLSLGADYLTDMCEARLSGGTRTHAGASACDWLHVPLRLLCGGLLVACNAVMWTFFSKALRHCSSSARATVTAAASNFISSAVLGRLVFGERHAALWWAGIGLTLLGLLLLHGAAPQTAAPEEDKKDR